MVSTERMERTGDGKVNREQRIERRETAATALTAKMVMTAVMERTVPLAETERTAAMEPTAGTAPHHLQMIQRMKGMIRVVRKWKMILPQKRMILL